ncbi:MAG: AsnC family transcriptional regulator [Desulfatiglandales bacterium]
MDDTDRLIINEIQSDFPIHPRPFDVLGARLNLSGSQVMERIRALKQEGVIRRIGGNFNSKRLNFCSTLCAAKVPDENLDQFVETVNSYSGVTHNYLRKHEYNVWFTFIGPDMASVDQALKTISETTGVTEIRNLPAVRTFKIKVDFPV